jgi:hypothetical protein
MQKNSIYFRFLIQKNDFLLKIEVFFLFIFSTNRIFHLFVVCFLPSPLYHQRKRGREERGRLKIFGH